MDCDDQAIRGQDFGVSLTVDHPETVDTEDVLDKVTRVLETPAFTERAERMGRLLQAAGGRVAAADLVLRLPALAGTDTAAARTA